MVYCNWQAVRFSVRPSQLEMAGKRQDLFVTRFFPKNAAMVSGKPIWQNIATKEEHHRVGVSRIFLSWFSWFLDAKGNSEMLA
jgi:hypothetical protein